MNKTNSLRTKALNLLARREHSKTELQQKLLQKNPTIDPTEIKTIIDQLANEGLLNESRFIENYIHFRREKGFGPIRIRAELLQRGLKEDFIDNHLDITHKTWLVQLQKLWQKKYKASIPKDFKSRAQQMRFFIYRGFMQEHIQKIISIEYSDVG